jgi:hypothetical protein
MSAKEKSVARENSFSQGGGKFIFPSFANRGKIHFSLYVPRTVFRRQRAVRLYHLSIPEGADL